MKPTEKTKSRLIFVFSFLIGALVWIASPYFTAQREPWDAQNLYYFGTLLIGGFVAGLLVPRRPRLWAIAIWLGQCVGFFWCIAHSPRVGPLAPLGFILFLPMYSVLSLLGAAVGSLLRE